MKNHIEKSELLHWIIRVPKDQAAFLYFQLEANEGLCFYSTLDQSLREPFRDIEIFSSSDLESEMKHFLENIKDEVQSLVILEERIQDSPDAVDKYSKGGKKTLV